MVARGENSTAGSLAKESRKFTTKLQLNEYKAVKAMK
jgi:hypothetical protein